ncbi:MAG: response regulator transcription factor [Chloroflexota bacterium]|nr:MAG: response regulator transcription factor [Chloroflexota bacterium]
MARLETAVRLAAPGSYRRAFLEEDRAVAALLPRLRHVSPAFVTLLLEDARAEPGRQRSAHLNQPLLEPLSDRELEVLDLIAGGFSNQEIADRLFITVGTVKTHAHNIYGKLDANGRTQAVARARELELL